MVAHLFGRKGRRILGVGGDARLEVALEHGGRVLGQLGQLARLDERAEDALLVGLDHDGVQHGAGGRAAEHEALHRLLEVLEGDVHDAGVVVVEQQVARRHHRRLLVHLQQRLLDHRLGGRVRLGEDAQLEELSVQRREVRRAGLQGERGGVERADGEERRLDRDRGGGELAAHRHKLLGHHADLLWVAAEQDGAALGEEGVDRLQVAERHGGRLAVQDEDHAQRVRRWVQDGQQIVELRHRLDQHLLLRLQVLEQLAELARARHLLDGVDHLLQPAVHGGGLGSVCGRARARLAIAESSGAAVVCPCAALANARQGVWFANQQGTWTSGYEDWRRQTTASCDLQRLIEHATLML